MNRIQMIRKTARLATLVVLIALIAGCSRSGKMQRGQQQYQVVQEGSASGVTSTINGPGETTPPVSDTNADTTTNFILSSNPNPLAEGTTGSTVVGSFPSNPIYPAASSPPPRPHETENRGMASAVPPVVIDTVGTTTPPMVNETRSAPADTASTSTSGTATTTTATDPQQPPPPKTDTTSTQRPLV
jgi:hypothetical protein